MKKVKILVLDDKEENRAKARELFQGKNVDLTCVDCFSTATTLLNKITYDIVLTDVSSYTSGSHELVLRYCFNADFNRTPGRYRSVRRL